MASYNHDSETITTTMPVQMYSNFYPMNPAQQYEPLGQPVFKHEYSDATYVGQHPPAHPPHQQFVDQSQAPVAHMPMGHVVGDQTRRPSGSHDGSTTQSLTSPVSPNGTAAGKASSSAERTTPPAAPARKRARKGAKLSSSSNDEDGGKKKRGRPRLDSEDTSTSDRRRTQIRLAQRSYRLRKEGTISNLQKRCERLQKTIEDMNKSFLTLTETFLSDHSANHLAPQVKATTEHFLDLARKSTKDIDGEERSEQSASQHDEPEAREVILLDQISEEKRDEISPSAETQYTQALGYVIPASSLPESSSALQPYNQVATTRPSQQSTAQLNPPYSFDFRVDPAGGIEAAQRRFNATLAAQFGSPVDSYLPMPPTYTPVEIGFSRRVQRRALEKALYVLTTEGIPDWMVTHVFKLSFCSSNRSDIVARLNFLLAGNERDVLDYHNVPFWRVGGSGTHFQDGSSVPSATTATRSVGPFALNRQEKQYENVGGECNTPEMMVQLTGFEGEWFDAADVERFLRSKGDNAEIDGPTYELLMSPVQTPSEDEAILAEVNDLESLGQSMAATTESDRSLYGPRTPANGQGNGTEYFHAGMEAFDTAWQASETELPTSTLPMTQNQTSLIFLANDMSAKPFAPPPPPPPKPQISVTISVDKFIEELTAQAICLGRSPGFRRSSVETAIAASTLPLAVEVQ